MADASPDGLSGDAQDIGDALVPNGGPALVNGAIQKGPFVLGSTVTLSAIDTSGVPTGQVFNTQTSDDLGDFSISFAYQGNVDMQAQGFYYDEVAGSLSSAPIVLRALYSVTNGGSQGAYINIITHLAHDRALALVGDAGTSLQAAEAQAESELVTALGIGGTSFQLGQAGITLNELGGDNDANAYLFAVSAVLEQAAREQAGATGSVDAQLQELVDTIATDLVTGGPLPSGVISQLRTAERDLDVDLAMDLFYHRLRAIASTATPADLNRAVDSDGDGYRNSVDTCPLVANPDQSQIPAGVLCKATRHTTFLNSGEPTNRADTCILAANFQNSGHVGAFGCGLGGAQGTAGLFAGDGSGRLAGPTAVQFDSLDGGPVSFVPELPFDIDQNGTVDLVGESAWTSGNGTFQFGAPSPFPAGSVGSGSNFYGIAVADFNGDKKPDVARVLYTETDFELAISLGQGGGIFPAPTLLPSGYSYSEIPSATSHPALLAGDMNGDGKVDLVYVGGYTYNNVVMGGTETFAGSAIVWLGDGSGGFQEGTSTYVWPSATPDGAAIADFDGDGNSDVATWAAGHGISVAFGNGTGGFLSVATTNVSNSLDQDAFIAGDFNSDGKADLAGFQVDSTNSNLADFVVVLSEGTAFAPAQQLRTSSVSQLVGNVEQNFTLTSGDFNGDGVPDALIVNPDVTGAWVFQAILMNVLQ